MAGRIVTFIALGKGLALCFAWSGQPFRVSGHFRVSGRSVIAEAPTQPAAGGASLTGAPEIDCKIYTYMKHRLKAELGRRADH